MAKNPITCEGTAKGRKTRVRQQESSRTLKARRKPSGSQGKRPRPTPGAVGGFVRGMEALGVDNLAAARLARELAAAARRLGLQDATEAQVDAEARRSVRAAIARSRLQ